MAVLSRDAGTLSLPVLVKDLQGKEDCGHYQALVFPKGSSYERWAQTDVARLEGVSESQLLKELRQEDHLSPVVQNCLGQKSNPSILGKRTFPHPPPYLNQDQNESKR